MVKTNGINTRVLLAMLAEHLREIAQRQGNIPRRTGNLYKSITSQVLSDREAVVGTNVLYARAVHDGAVIRPKRAKVLAFKAPPGWSGPISKKTGLAIARKVTIKPNPYLARAAERFAREPLPSAIRDYAGEETARALEDHFKRLGMEVTRG